MSKELEALERLAMPDEIHIKECKKLGIGLTEDYEIIEQALNRLEAIDNANPSEALKEIGTLRGFNKVELKDDKNVNKSLDVIKQALLKTQELEKELEEYKKLNLPLLKKVLENGVWVKDKNKPLYHLNPEDMNVKLKEDYFIIEELYFEDLDCVMDTTGFELHSSDYKKNWWIKEDKSE